MNNYATPQRCAEALRKYLKDKNFHILDIGCGTGLSGQEILNVGFNNVDGSDFSENMLYEAKKKYMNVFPNERQQLKEEVEKVNDELS